MKLDRMIKVAKLLKDAGGNDVPALLLSFNTYQIRELYSLFGKPSVSKLSFFDRVLRRKPKITNSLLFNFAEAVNEFNYELSKLKSEPKEDEHSPKASLYEVLLDYDTQLRAMNRNPAEWDLEDAKIFIENSNRKNLLSNLYSIRDQLKPNDRAIFDMDFKDFEQANYDIDIYKRMKDFYIDRLRARND